MNTDTDMYIEIASLNLGSTFEFEFEIEFSCVTNEAGDCPQFDCFWEEIENNYLKLENVLFYTNNDALPGVCYEQMGSCIVTRGDNTLCTLNDLNYLVEKCLNRYISDWTKTNCKIVIK